MPFYRFGDNDIIYNRIKAHPKCNFIIHNKKIHYNNNTNVDGNISAVNLKHIPTGNLSLHEINIDRPTSDLIYPFLTKEGSLTSFRTISTSAFNSDFLYGDTITGSYPMSASISIDHYSDTITDSLENGHLRPTLSALRNTIEHYSTLSKKFSSTAYYTSKTTLISIPSIYYGSSIKKGSVKLKFYITGTLAGELQDFGKNGELVQVSGSATDLGTTYGSGSTAGIVLYNEGFIILTGSWDLDPGHSEGYVSTTSENPQWIHFATTGSSTFNPTHSAFDLSFEGTTYIPVATMMAHAPKGLLNYSNNPTYIKKDVGLIYATSSEGYIEKEREIKNTVSASFSEDPTGSFEKQTWISKIGIFDEHKNLIAYAKLANPVKKTEDRDFTFKLKLDF
tara:strand:+ start:68 stop:1246 length:1179 start_codon:yes stop_codon:yes gene_type:complete